VWGGGVFLISNQISPYEDSSTTPSTRSSLEKKKWIVPTLLLYLGTAIVLPITKKNLYLLAVLNAGFKND